MNNTVEEKERALLIAIDTGDEREAELSIDELERLADTAGAITVGKVIQKRSEPHPATYIGMGKIKELADFCRENEIDTVIADDEISGSQTKELESLLDVKVIDRTTLILDIFAMRARSAEGRLQIELAQLQYRLPRLAGLGKALSRLGGGIGTRGPGESKLETDKRHIRRRIFAIKQALKEVADKRSVSRRSRSKNGAKTCALVGYTNAGKSTLLNTICGSDAYVMDQLFATLDTTARKIDFSDTDITASNIIMIDTVGFIRKLPHTLVDAFKSTLEESITADLIIHVADISDHEVDKHIEIVEKILCELGTNEKQSFLVFNKCDNCNANNEASAVILKQALDKNPNVFMVSAKTGEGISSLKQAIGEHFGKDEVYEMLIPYNEGKWLNFLYSEFDVIESDNRDEGTYIKVRACLAEKDKFALKKYII